MRGCLLGVLTALLSIAASEALAQTEYNSADEAYRAGAKLLAEGKEEESIEPLEAALKLAPDEALRLKTQQALLRGYRTLPEIDKMVETSEAIIRDSDSATVSRQTTGGLVSFLRDRGRLEYAIERYEQVLKEAPDDRAALGVLAAVYGRLRRDPARAEELSKRLAEADRKAARNRGGRMEQDAAAAPQLASWYWKEAAAAWLAAGDQERALAAAKQAVAAGPDQRSDLLAHFWHRSLADVFLAAGEPQSAIEHYRKAAELTAVEGYRRDCQAGLAKAEALLAGEKSP